MHRKFLAAILALAMALCLLPAAALAVDEEFTFEGIKYKVLSDPGTTPGTVEVIANGYSERSYTIPASVPYNGNDYTVKKYRR